MVIPLYNKGLHIKRAIDSVLNQTFQNFEIIIIDDGSTDEGVEVVRGCMDHRIRLIQQKNKGVSTARNRGVSAAEADLIAFLDADDEWFPGHLEEIMKLKNNFPSAGMFVTNYYYITERGNKKSPNIKCVPKPPWRGLLSHYFLTASLGEMPFNISTMAIPTTVYELSGGFLQQWNWAEDHELWGRIALHYPIAYSWEPGACWYHDAQNRLGHQTPPLEIQPVYTTIKKYISENQVQTEQLYELEEFLATKEIDFSIRLFQAGQIPRARLVLKKCKTRLFKLRKLGWMILFYSPKPLYLSLKFIKFLLGIER